MGLETITYISDVNIANPAAGDPKSEGDDHIRRIKIGIKNTFPNINGAVTVTDEELNFMVGVTSGVQAQLNTLTSAKVAKSGDTYTGTHNFTGATVTVATPTADSHPVTKLYADQLAFSAVLPNQAGNNRKILTTNGTTASWQHNPVPPSVAYDQGAL